MSWHFLFLNCHVWEPKQIVLYPRQKPDDGFCLLPSAFCFLLACCVFFIWSCLDKEGWSKKKCSCSIWNISGCSAETKLSYVASLVLTDPSATEPFPVNHSKELLGVRTAGAGCPHRPGFAALPHLSSDFFHVFPSLLAAFFTTSGGRWEISPTLSRISRKSVQSTEVAVIITSPESLIITIWHMLLSSEWFFTWRFSPKGNTLWWGSNHQVCVETTVALSPAVLTDTSEAGAQQVHPRNINGKKNYRLRLKKTGRNPLGILTHAPQHDKELLDKPSWTSMKEMFC